MSPVDYVKKLRIVAGVSWLGMLGILFLLASLNVIPLNEYTPFIALTIGFVPIILFMRRNKPTCPSCGGSMKVSSGFPRIIYRCTKCSAESDTGITSG